MPPLPADFIHTRVCKPFCEKSLTLPDYTFIDQDRLGTVQLSDIFYNTLGGTIGGLIYYLCTKLQRKKDEPSVDEKKG